MWKWQWQDEVIKLAPTGFQDYKMAVIQAMCYPVKERQVYQQNRMKKRDSGIYGHLIYDKVRTTEQKEQSCSFK